MKKEIRLLLAIYLGIIIVILLAGCGSSDFKRSGNDTIYTTIKVAADIVGNKYPDLTAMKIFYDTTRISGDRVTWFRDSMYRVPVPGKDSSGTFTVWNDVPKQFILDDYCRNWPLMVK